MYKQIRQHRRKLTAEEEDEDQDRSQAKNPWGALSETWGLNDVVEDDFLPRGDAKDQGRSIKERLGFKHASASVSTNVNVNVNKRATAQGADKESGETSSSSDSEENWCKRSKVLRMRMHADDEEEKQQKRRAKLRYQVSKFCWKPLSNRNGFFVEYFFC